jgi:hypothetical protein
LGSEHHEIFHQYEAHLDRKGAANNPVLLKKARDKGIALLSEFS